MRIKWVYHKAMIFITKVELNRQNQHKSENHDKERPYL